jgi:hypothetical protein
LKNSPRVFLYVESIMPPRLPKLGVQIVGRQFLRFLIANDRQEYWTGADWSPDRAKALIYAHLHLIRSDLRKLKRNRKTQ